MRKDRCSSGTAALRWAPDPRETPSLGGAPERLEDPLSGWGGGGEGRLPGQSCARSRDLGRPQGHSAAGPPSGKAKAKSGSMRVFLSPQQQPPKLGLQVVAEMAWCSLMSLATSAPVWALAQLLLTLGPCHTQGETEVLADGLCQPAPRGGGATSQSWVVVGGAEVSGQRCRPPGAAPHPRPTIPTAERCLQRAGPRGWELLVPKCPTPLTPLHCCASPEGPGDSD